MPALLPLELKQQIIGEALAPPPSRERQQTRQTIRRVSREWRDSVNYWKEIEVIEMKQVEALLEQADAQLDQVKSAYIEVVTRVDRDSKRADKVAALIERMINLESVSIVTVLYLISDHVGVVPLASSIVEALAGLPRVIHFAFKAPAELGTVACIDSLSLESCLLNWPALKSLELGRTAFPNDRRSQVFANYPGLTSLVITVSAGQRVFRWPLKNLPPGLSSLTINGTEVYVKPQTAELVCRWVARRATGLRKLAIVSFPPLDTQVTPPRVRLAYDALLPQLSGLEELTISPAALTSMSTSLSHLPRLHKLHLVQGGLCPASLATRDEMCACLIDSRSVRKVVVSRGLWDDWATAERAAIEAAAALKSIALEQI